MCCDRRPTTTTAPPDLPCLVAFSPVNLMRMSHAGGCPCHSCQAVKGGLNVAKAGLNMIQKHNAQGGRSYATPVDDAVAKEYTFEVSEREGPVTRHLAAV